MNAIAKRRLLITIAVVLPLTLILWFLWPLLFWGGLRDITRENRVLINQMKASEHGHLIRRVRMSEIGTISIRIFIRSSARNEEVLALANEIMPLIEETFSMGSVHMSFRFNDFDTLYSFFGRSRHKDEPFEWSQTWPEP